MDSARASRIDTVVWDIWLNLLRVDWVPRPSCAWGVAMAINCFSAGSKQAVLAKSPRWCGTLYDLLDFRRWVVAFPLRSCVSRLNLEFCTP